MAIFWRTLDWRSYKKIEDQQVYRTEEEYMEEYDFPDTHRMWMQTAMNAAADSMIYLSHMGWEELPNVPRGYEDGPCDWNEIPSKPPALSVFGVADTLDWVPLRLRWSIARVLHFAIAVFVERLHLEKREIYLQLPIHYLAYWLVQDVLAFFDIRIANTLLRWLGEIYDQWNDGDHIDIVESLYLSSPIFVTAPLSNVAESNTKTWRVKPFAPNSQSVFSKRARQFDYSTLSATVGQNVIHKDEERTEITGKDNTDDDSPDTVSRLCYNQQKNTNILKALRLGLGGKFEETQTAQTTRS